MRSYRSNVPVAIGLIVLLGLIVILFDASRTAHAAEWFSSAATVLAAVIGAAIAGGVIAWQVRTQAQLSLDQAKVSEATRLKSELYRTVIQEIATTTDPAANLHVLALTAVNDIETALRIRREVSGSKVVPRRRVGDYWSAWNAYRINALRVVRLVEEWRFIDPRMEIFQTAIHVAMKDIDIAFQEFDLIARRVLPVDVPLLDGRTLTNWAEPDVQALNAFSVVASKLASAIPPLGNYIDDFRSEMQRTLLGELFDFSKVEPRKPLDPALLVISLDRSVELNAYFQNETAWGREKAAAEQRVRQELSGSPS